MIAAFIICLILICITSFLHLVSEEVCRAYRRRIGHLLSLVYHKSIFAFKYHFVRGDENRGFESFRIKKRPIRDRSFLNWGTLPSKMIKYHFVRGDENRGFESLRIKKRPIRDRSFNWLGHSAEQND